MVRHSNSGWVFALFTAEKDLKDIKDRETANKLMKNKLLVFMVFNKCYISTFEYLTIITNNNTFLGLKQVVLRINFKTSVIDTIKM